VTACGDPAPQRGSSPIEAGKLMPCGTGERIAMSVDSSDLVKLCKVGFRG
jgi:hypothetical protein